MHTSSLPALTTLITFIDSSIIAYPTLFYWCILYHNLIYWYCFRIIFNHIYEIEHISFINPIFPIYEGDGVAFIYSPPTSRPEIIGGVPYWASLGFCVDFAWFFNVEAMSFITSVTPFSVEERCCFSHHAFLFHGRLIHVFFMQLR